MLDLQVISNIYDTIAERPKNKNSAIITVINLTKQDVNCKWLTIVLEVLILMTGLIFILSADFPPKH